MNDQSPVSTSTELVLPDAKDLTALFSTENGIKDLVASIKADVQSEVPDLTSVKGRKRITSLCHKVAQSKVFMDAVGKKLNESARAQIAIIDEQRRFIKKELDQVRDDYKQPLIDWQATEDERLQKHQDAMAVFAVIQVNPTMSSETITAIMDVAKGTTIDDSWEEFQALAKEAQEEALAHWANDLGIAKDREEQAAKIKRLEAEAEERAREDEQDRIKRQAKETARRDKEEAERVKAAEAKAEYARKKEAAKAEELRLKEAAEAEKKHQEELERTRIEAKETAKREAEEAATRKAEEHKREMAAAKQREDDAAENERQRLADERASEKRARKKREADTAHRKRILGEIGKAMAPIPREQIPEALVDGRIPYVRVLL